jgi:nitrate reductase delta subunit
MLGTFRKSPETLAGLERVKEWTRKVFDLSERDIVLVSEVNCTYPGCVPIETVVGFWTSGDQHHHFKIFKPATEVVWEDMPPAWLKDDLLVTEYYQCSCC